MTTRPTRAGALAALALLATSGALAQDASPTPSTLEEKVRALEEEQKELARRLEGLRKELEASRQPTPAPTPSPTPTPTPAPAPAPSPGPVVAPGLTPLSFPLLGTSGSVTSGTSFNPSISVIPDFVYALDDRQGDGGEILASADGFHAPEGEADGHDHGGLEEGFNFRETELAFKASVDPYFDVTALFAASEDGLSAEEVYFQTRRLPAGLGVKAGKFFSGIGYLNSQHPHQWDFVDTALPYQLLLGGNLAEKGIQVTWLPKLPVYLQVGAELLQGENELVAGYHGGEDAGPVPVEEGDEPGPDRVFSHKPGPRLFTGFVKLAPDVGFSDALQVGLSYARSTLHEELHDEDGDGVVEEALEGTVDLFGVDVVFKHDAPHEYGRGDWTLQAEYLYRRKLLDLLGTTGRLDARQDGAYLQAVWGVLPRVQLAARLDVAGITNRVTEEGATASYDPTRRLTAAVTFNPTEFSRFRVQWDRSDVPVGGASESVDRLLLMVQMSLGAHGAHKF